MLELCAAPLKAVLEPLLASQQLQHDQRLHSFHKVCEAVAHLHMLSPPIVHRDLKVSKSPVKEIVYIFCLLERAHM